LLSPGHDVKGRAPGSSWLAETNGSTGGANPCRRTFHSSSGGGVGRVFSPRTSAHPARIGVRGKAPISWEAYMRVLVACEYSGKVREAFRRKGHSVWSCDLLPSDDGSDFHIQGDCIPVIKRGWDLIIMHPPCTA